MRTWITKTPYSAYGVQCEHISMDGFFPISIYKDTTGQYTDEECDRNNCVEIPVPKNLVIQWFHDTWNIEAAFGKFGELGYTEDEFLRDVYFWVYEESTCDETNDLYDWLCKHNYYWKRLD